MKTKEEIIAYLQGKYPLGISPNYLCWIINYTNITSIKLQKHIRIAKDEWFDIIDFMNFCEPEKYPLTKTCDEKKGSLEVKLGVEVRECDQCEYKKKVENNDTPFEMNIPKPKFHRGDKVKMKGGTDVMTVVGVEMGYGVNGVYLYYKLKNHIDGLNCQISYIHRNEEDLELVKDFHQDYVDSMMMSILNIHEYAKSHGDEPKSDIERVHQDTIDSLSKVVNEIGEWNTVPEPPSVVFGFRRGCEKTLASLFAFPFGKPEFVKGNSYKYRNEERRELKEQLEVFRKLRDRKKSGLVYKLACEDIARIEKMLEERV